MRVSDWSSDVCSSDLVGAAGDRQVGLLVARDAEEADGVRPFDRIFRDRARLSPVAEDARLAGQQGVDDMDHAASCSTQMAAASAPSSGTPSRPQKWGVPGAASRRRSEEHTSELQSLMRIPYAVFCL